MLVTQQMWRLQAAGQVQRMPLWHRSAASTPAGSRAMVTMSWRLVCSCLALPLRPARELADEVLDCTADLPKRSYLHQCQEQL